MLNQFKNETVSKTFFARQNIFASDISDVRKQFISNKAKPCIFVILKLLFGF